MQHTRHATATRYEAGDAASLRVFSELYVDRPPRALWALFADVRRWAEWSPICSDCRVAPAGTLAPGAALTMRLRFLFFAADVRATLSCVRPGHEIGWEATRFGVEARHRYSLRPRGRGSLVSNEELLSGLGPALRPLVRGFFRLTDLSLESLRGLKRLAESEAPPTGRPPR